MSSIAVDLTDDVKSRSASSAPPSSNTSAATPWCTSLQLSPGLAQDVLAELPNEARSALPPRPRMSRAEQALASDLEPSAG